MGSNASKGRNNDELVDNLLRDQFLKTYSIQQIFRAVDRGLYFTKESRKHAYDDTAWRSGNIHLSAPGIYCVVLENLELGEGMSFLNLGSGTGYLNTMAGLILGSYGLNYGVELHKDIIQYAYNRLEKFKWNAEAIDEYDFCEPKFFEGNCLHLSTENRLYDRVYCGASCPPSHENYMKNLIKINGILVMPLEESLVKIKRTSETSWEKKTITPVNFANMILPKPCDANNPQLLLSNPEPLSLQVICRTTVRQILRKIIREENPNLKNHRIRKDLWIPNTTKGSDSPLDGDFLGRDPSFRMFLLNKQKPPFFSWVSPDMDEDEDDLSSFGNEECDEEEEDEDMERNGKETDGENDSDNDENADRTEEGGAESPPLLLQTLQNRLKRKKTRQTRISLTDSETDEEMDVECGQSSSIEENESRKKTENGDKGVNAVSESSSKGETGESSGEKPKDSADCSSTNNNVESSAESDDGEEKYNLRLHPCGGIRELMIRQRIANLRKMRRKVRSLQRSSEIDSEDESNQGRISDPPNVYPSYSVLMREKIHALPLPPTIQSYLNFHRTF